MTHNNKTFFHTNNHVFRGDIFEVTAYPGDMRDTTLGFFNNERAAHAAREHWSKQFPSAKVTLRRNSTIIVPIKANGTFDWGTARVVHEYSPLRDELYIYEKNRKKREAALAKLTEEEKEILGLKNQTI